MNKLLFLFAVSAILLLIYALAEARLMRVKNQNLYSKKLPPEFDGFRIAFVSDIHNISACGRRTRRMVRKINAYTCSVTFQIEDLLLLGNNITFGSEFQTTGSDSYKCMTFETKQATGFSTPEYVRDELLRQFNWSQISTNITQLDVLNYGDFTHTPMVTLRFEAQYRD